MAQALSGRGLVELSKQELDQLFGGSPAGEIPRGECEGTVIVDPGTELSEIAAKVAHAMLWQGKVFDPDEGKLRNKIPPFGVKAISAKVYKDASWSDEKECIVVDYSETSLVAHRGRDELRQVGPEVYLGISYWGRHRLLYFALDFAP